MVLPGRIQQLRRRMGLSQERLAEEMGVSRQAISKWESGAAVPEVDKLIQLARFFGVTVDDLLGVAPAAGGEDLRAEKPEAAPAVGDPGVPPVPAGADAPAGCGAAAASGAPAEDTGNAAAPGTEERLRVLEGLVAGLAAEQHRRERWWLAALVLAAVLVAAALAGVMRVHIEFRRYITTPGPDLNVIVGSSSRPSPEPEEPEPPAGKAAYLRVDSAAQTVVYRVTATPGDLAGGTTAELLLVRGDGTAEAFPAEIVGSAACQGEVPVPWVGESTVSLVLSGPEPGSRRTLPVYVFRDPGMSLKLYLQSTFAGTTDFPAGKVRFRGVIQWQSTRFGGERLPVENRAVSARAVVTVDGEALEEVPIPLENAESQWAETRVPFEGEYPLSPGQELALAVVTTDSFGQEYREVLARYAAGADGLVQPAE